MSRQGVFVNRDGHIVLTDELIQEYGLLPGTEVFIEKGADKLLLSSPVSRMARIYVEPTSLCNLNCATCIRNAWDEPMGSMTPGVFQGILEALETVGPVPGVFFGGFGEPLSHPDILAMIREVKKRGAAAELISNGILLDRQMADSLVELGLDRLWISIDGVSPESYEDIRLGNQLELIKSNLKYLKGLKRNTPGDIPAVGITFVAMKRNIRDLPGMTRLLHELGADTLHVSNVLPHTREMKEEILYSRGLMNQDGRADRMIFPRMDMNGDTGPALKETFSKYEIHDSLDNGFLNPRNRCPFIEKGSVSVRYDGRVSPCLPLLHTAASYLKDYERINRETFFGSLEETSLTTIWQSREYTEFRKRVMQFDFSPCTGCSGCEMSESNQEDCSGSLPVSCGGCLWAQGFIRCP